MENNETYITKNHKLRTNCPQKNDAIITKNPHSNPLSLSALNHIFNCSIAYCYHIKLLARFLLTTQKPPTLEIGNNKITMSKG